MDYVFVTESVSALGDMFSYVYLKDALCGWTSSCVFAYVVFKVSTKEIDEVQTETIPITWIMCLLQDSIGALSDLFCYVYLKDALCGWTCSCVFA